MKSKIKNISIGLVLVFGLAACSTPNTTSGTNNQNQGLSSSQESTGDLTSYHDDEATFSDSEFIASQESSFATKALVDVVADVKVNTNLQAALEAAGAIVKNADGSVTVNKELLKTTIKAFIAAHKVEIKEDIEKIKDRLTDKKEIAKDKAEKLKNKIAKVRTSNVVEVTNADGSVTKTMSVEFKSGNMTKENIISKTSLNGKMLTMTHTLNITSKSFTKEATRIMTFNADGSKKVVTESVTTFKNGRSREVYETREIAADGSGSGTGTITVTDKNGNTTTKNLDVTITASGTTNEQIKSKETDGTKTVTLNEHASGKATVAVSEAGKPAETSEIDVEAQEEQSASAS